MAITKVTSGLISADASSIDLNIDAGTLYLDVSENRVGIGTTSPSAPLTVSKSTGYTEVTVASGSQEIDLFTNSTGSTCGLLTASNIPIIFYNNSTERMRIDSSGKVGIGTTSPSELLHLSSAEPVLRFTDSDDGNYHHIFSSSNDFYISADRNDSGSGNLIFRNGGTSERMRIGSDGKVYFGNQDNAAASGYIDKQTSGNYEFKIHASTSTGTNRAITFHNRSNTEAMRIDSSGNVLVGTTNNNPAESNTTGASILGGGDGRLLLCVDSNEVAQFNRKTSDGTILVFRQNAVARGSVSISGANTSYNTTSDARLKDVTGEARGLEVINKLNPVAYNWKEDGKADEGLIAQEVLDIVPNAVSGSEEEMYQMDYSKLVTPLIKAIQELSDKVDNQQTIIDDLKTRIETLENA